MPTLVDTIVDDIYEAAVLPQLWPAVLERLGGLVDAWGAAIYSVTLDRGQDFHATERYRPHIERAGTMADQTNNPRPTRALARKHAGFLTDLDLCTLEELEADPIYRDFLFPLGVGWTVGSIIPVPNGDFMIFDIARARDRGPFERSAVSTLDRLRPHLARSSLLAARLNQRHAEAAAAVLQALGLPGAVVGQRGRVLAMNTLMEQCAPQMQARARDRLTLAHRPSNDILDNALERIEHDRSIRSIPVPAYGDMPGLVSHVIPIRRQAHDIFASATALFVATPLAAPAPPEAGLLSGLFDLTPAEDRVARAIAEGHSVESGAAALSVSPETIRTQLKSVMAKTGTSRQTELVGLLAGTTSFPLPQR